MIYNSGLFITFVEWLLVVKTVSESYTRSYEGYVFTFPGFSASVKRDEAQRWCTQNGSTLLEINSSNLQALTVRFLRDTGVQFGDGTLLFTNGLRIDGSLSWVNGKKINSVTVAGQSPNLANSFGYINSNAAGISITASIPTETRSYICQGKFDCTNGFPINDLCHESYSSGPKMSWFDARNQCINEGGDLASFDFINDDQGLNSALNGSWLSSSTTYWIGIRKQLWTWQTSNLEVIYSNWDNGRPQYIENVRCLCLYKRYKSGADWTWIECDCSLNYPFVCLTVQPTTLPTSSFATEVTTTTPTTNILTSSGFTSRATAGTAITLSSTGDNGLGTRLGIGLGVGGGLIIAAIVIVVFFVIRKRGCPRKTNPPDVTLHPIDSHYAEISKQPGYESTSPQDANGNQFTQPVVYSDLEIFAGSSLISSKMATLAPPSTHKATTHFTVDGQEYAEVKEVRL